MTEQHDRDELVELMSRYANMPDTRNRDDLPRCSPVGPCHGITNHRIAIDGDRATIRAHVRAEHWAPSEVAAGAPNCWLVVGFYDDVAVRTPEHWRLSSVKRPSPTRRTRRCSRPRWRP
jgi:hypothetical protein